MTSYNDRVEGVLLGTAAGDALGAPYEFQPPRGQSSRWQWSADRKRRMD
jgi:ADP-ribosylglycohydrolase